MCRTRITYDYSPNREKTMLNRIILSLFITALAMMLTPSKVAAYGAAHVGYTHVGPNGAYHVGETAYRGPGGTYAAGRTGAVGYGGAEYRGGSEYRAGYGGAAGAADYRYVPSYGGAYGASYHYGYVR
jgi:hypothetical protein